MKKFTFISIVFVSCSLVIVSSLFGCGSTQGGTTTTTSSTSTTLAPGSASITGQVAANTSDITISGCGILSTKKPTFRTLANSVMANATVKLYEINASGTETDTGKTATTDSSGNYTLSAVDPISSGVYKVVATKTVGSNTVQVETLTVVNTSTAETANVAPETSIATAMFDDVIKDKFSKIIVNQDTMEEMKNLVVDDTETLVNNSKLALPSMTTSNAGQIGLAASGIAENNGNADKSFKKLEIENMGNIAKVDDNQDMGEKYLNEITLCGPGQNYLVPKEAVKAMADAYISGETKTVTQVVDAVNVAAGKSLSVTTVLSGFNQQLADIKTKYDKLKAGTGDEIITEPEYMVFSASSLVTLEAATSLEVNQQIVLENYIKQNLLSAGETVNEIKFIDQLGYIKPGSGISTTESFFQDVNLYYGSYSGWKLGGSIQLYFPSGSGITASAVNLKNSSGTSFSLGQQSLGSTTYTLASQNGPTMATGTNRFTLEATLSNASILTTPVTLEFVEIPEPTVQRIDGVAFENLQDPAPYYSVTPVSDKMPIIKWSTAEITSVTIPSGYSWAYSLALTRYGTKAGATTLEVDTSSSASVYDTGNDLGQLLTNDSFLMPVELSAEVSGAKVAYKIYVQRILLNAQGKFNGIAAGAFRYTRYQP